MIWIGTEFYYPETNYASGHFLTGISESLAEQNNVSVLCASQHYIDNNPVYFEEYNGVYVHRIKSTNLNKNRISTRILRFVIISLRFLFFFLKKVRKNDTLIIVTNPAPLIFIGRIIKKIRKCKLIIIVHDVFPENLIATGLLKKGSIVYKILFRLFNNSYASSDQLVTLGRDMQNLFTAKLKRYPGKIHCIQNWGDSESIRPDWAAGNKILNQFSIQDKYVFQYSGNLGRAQGLPALLQAAKNVKNEKAHFLFFGNGVFTDYIKEQSLNTKNITYGGVFNRTDSNSFLNACHVSVVTLLDGIEGLGVPSKTYDIMAAGKPILYIGKDNSEIGLLINEEKIGKVVAPNDSEKIAEAIDYFNTLNNDEYEEMSKRTREILLKKYSKKLVLSKYKKLI